MKDFQGKVAVITGAASGFGREFALLGAKLGMRLVLADVQREALDATAAELQAAGAEVLAQTCDVRKGEQVEALAQAAMQRFGAIHLVFNNAGVGAGGLVWESTQADWEWVLGVNLWGVIHGVRIFTPLMLECAKKDPAYEGHIVNTASMAGLLTPPTMGVYNVSKHSVVALTETLYHDLMLVEAPIGASVLCPYFVPTGISQSERVRPGDVQGGTQTRSQQVSQAVLEKAVASGKVTAAEVAERTFEAIRDGQFYIYSHPQALGNVERRMQDIVSGRNPSDPYEAAPHVRDKLRAGLKEA
jgi:NAD(P)-dependent dehydrogenase (short-subunit alcohol dehydrogenase family)